ncbi:MAG: sulfite exporter TauE/SafE family protein [Saprospiraceae bacterium]|nr:sulfite exporter TauE/SafE family protein [Saprospiraceae bacterium]
MNLNIWEYVLAMTGSFIAGAINTLAGNGSIITLSILTDLIGLPPNVANATNRVGIFFQSAGSTGGFAKNKFLDFNRSGFVIFWTVIGSLAGVYCAIKVSNEQFLSIFKYLMILMLIVVLVNPERWLVKNVEIIHISQWLSIPIFLILGFYGGFIQMGMGIFFLAVLVLVSKYEMMEANAIKTIVILVYTTIVLAIFAWRDLVNWEVGIVMAIGQTLGGYLTAAHISSLPGINVWAHKLLVMVIILSILVQFGIFKILVP